MNIIDEIDSIYTYLKLINCEVDAYEKRYDNSRMLMFYYKNNKYILAYYPQKNQLRVIIKTISVTNKYNIDENTEDYNKQIFLINFTKNILLKGE